MTARFESKAIRDCAAAALVFAAVLSLPYFSNAQQIHKSSGMELLDLMRAHQRVIDKRGNYDDLHASGRVYGFIDGVIETYSALAINENRSIGVCMSSVTFSQVVFIVDRHLQENAARLNLSGSQLVLEALQKNFPCR